MSNNDLMFLTEGELREVIHIVITSAMHFSRKFSERRYDYIAEAAPEMYELIRELALTNQPEYPQLKERAKNLLGRFSWEVRL